MYMQELICCKAISYTFIISTILYVYIHINSYPRPISNDVDLIHSSVGTILYVDLMNNN